MRLRRLTTTETVLGLLCMMYLITYVDRVNIATAASEIRRELSLSNTQLGFILSAFGYPYIVFQIFGGWLGDRVGPRRTLFMCGLVWAAATILTGLVGSLTTLFLARVMLGFGEGATFPVATRAMQAWTPAGQRGFAQGITHAFARFGNAVTPPIVAWLISVVTWRGSFVMLGLDQPCLGCRLGVVLPRQSRRASRDHERGAGAPSESRSGTGQDARRGALEAARSSHVAGHGRVFLLRLDVVDVSELAPVVSAPRIQPAVEPLGAFRGGDFFCRCRRRLPGRCHHRHDSQADWRREESQVPLRRSSVSAPRSCACCRFSSRTISPSSCSAWARRSSVPSW